MAENIISRDASYCLGLTAMSAVFTIATSFGIISNPSRINLVVIFIFALIAIVAMTISLSMYRHESYFISGMIARIGVWAILRLVGLARDTFVYHLSLTLVYLLIVFVLLTIENIKSLRKNTKQVEDFFHKESKEVVQVTDCTHIEQKSGINMIYKCSHCGNEFKYRPDSCPGCGQSQFYEKIE